MSRDPRRRGRPKRDHLEVFREAVRREIAIPTSETNDPILLHLHEAGMVMRQHVHNKTGRWPTLEDEDAQARDMGFLTKSLESYWRIRGIEWIPLEDIDGRQQEFARTFYDAFYDHAERTPLPGEVDL